MIGVMHPLEEAYQAAMAFHRASRLDEAESQYRQILAADPLFARAWHLLGVLKHQRGDTPGALDDIRRALALEPAWAVFSVNLATILAGEGRPAEAESVLRQALAREPSNSALLTNLGVLWSGQNRCDEAMELLAPALPSNPNNPQLLAVAAYCQSELGFPEQAGELYRQAHRVTGDPHYRVLAGTQLPLVYASRADLLAWRERLTRGIEQLLAEGVRVPLDKPAMPVFSLPHQGFVDLELHQKYASLFRPPPVESELWQPRSGTRARIGFLSSYLGLHTIGKLARQWITRLPRDEFEVTVFSAGSFVDEISRELQASADRFLKLPRELAHARQVILRNSVDLLLYTDIGMDSATYSLAFSRLAPVQCTTWGHPETTGLATIDIFLSSAEMETPEADAHYGEKLVRLPSLTFGYTRSQLPAALQDRAAFGLPEQARLYACPQSIYKLHPDFDEALAGILRADPNGRIVLIEWAYRTADEQLRRRFARVMPDVADQILFVRRLKQPEFMNFLTLQDVLLDPFPYGGGNSSLEAFSFGVPVVTWPTALLRGRITQAFCRRLGIDECIASSLEDYVEKAVRIARQPQWRKELSDRILANQDRLFDDPWAITALADFLRSATRRPFPALPS